MGLPITSILTGFSMKSTSQQPAVLGVPPLVKNRVPIRPCQALDSVDVPNIRQAMVATVVAADVFMNWIYPLVI